MLDDRISFNKVLVSLESTLKLEVMGDNTTQQTIDNAVANLENTYHCTFDRDVWLLMGESQLSSVSLSQLVNNLQQALAELSLYIELKLYHKNLAISLADVNYLGYAKEQLNSALKYLQDVKLAQPNRQEYIKPYYTTLNNIPMCMVKRLVIVMLMLDRIGVYEGVAIVAQLLYLGGLV